MSDNLHSNDKRGEDGKKVILLDLSRTERAFEEDESLWDIEIEKIDERLAGHIESLKKYEDEKDIHKKPMLSIAILGYPGSGKTSMLHTLVERVNREKPVKKLHQNVSSLPVIKPNLVVKDDHFLYAFLAEALRMDRLIHANEDDPDRETQIISRVQHNFQEVSEYLQVLNEAGHKHEGDPLGVSLERLERHESGLMLIEKMAGFIDELANSLGNNTPSSVVLLPVDDADVSLDVLISALDTCRRFIKHPRLVPIFSFTGRLAEELLRVHYDERINSDSSSEKLKEASTSLLVTENMALQYLGRLFPVRNRIKMGPASARLQAAQYRPLKGGTVKDVSDLLKKASRLLFGHSQFLAGHSICPPLRVVTLRRQIQIIDAIQGTGIEQFMEETAAEKLKPWAEIFDLATWSLLNAHRDVLKEIHLNLDDLYSWTPKGLRQVILDCILMQKKDSMDKLHKHWRYRTDDRRSQITSLLAVNIFRPRMGEEPTVDNAPEIIDEWWDNFKNKGKEKDKEIEIEKEKLRKTAESFPLIKGALWFLNLCIGFYLPQVFSWRGLPGNEEKDMETSRVTGIGWGLLSGPLHAVREALKKKKVFSSGMLFLNPKDFNGQLIDNNPNKNYRFFVHIWCYYGFHDEWPWAAISLWRGLGLMGKVIEVFENYRKYPDDDGNCIFVDKNKVKEKKEIILIDEKIENDLSKRIEKVIIRHFESARVFSNLPKGKEIKGGFQELNSENWEFKDDAGAAPGTEDSITGKITAFAGAMTSWLKENWSTLIEIEEEGKKVTKKKENRIIPMEEGGDWASSFVRRLHGDSLMSIFWQNLENAYFKKKLGDWNAGLVLYRWKNLLSQYWEGCDKIKALLESCPIWPDFKSHDLYKHKQEDPGQKDSKQNTKEFDWGAVRIYSLEEYEEKAREYINKLEDAYKKKFDEEALKKLKKEHKIEDEKADKNKDKKEALEKLKAKYIETLEEEYEKNGKKKTLKELKTRYEIEDEVEYQKQLEKEKDNLEKEKQKLVNEANKDNVEKKIKEFEENIKNIEIYNEVVELKYNKKIMIARAELEGYLLFSDD